MVSPPPEPRPPLDFDPNFSLVFAEMERDAPDDEDDD